jgi:hypothetical protein
VFCEGTGEANRAIDAALGTGLPAVRPRNDPGEEDIGTGRGLAEDSPFPGVDMVRGRCSRNIAVVRLLPYLMIIRCRKRKFSCCGRSSQPQFGNVACELKQGIEKTHGSR